MKPGYYYARWLEDGEKDPLIIIKVMDDKTACTYGDKIEHSITKFKNIKGPLNPETMLSPSHPK